MKNLYPILIIGLSAILAITMIIKVATVYKYASIKRKSQHNLLKAYLIFVYASIMIWFPILYGGHEINLKKISQRINLLTVIFYLVIISLGLVVYFYIQSLQSFH